MVVSREHLQQGSGGHVGQSQGHTRPPESELWVVGDSEHPWTAASLWSPADPMFPWLCSPLCVG